MAAVGHSSSAESSTSHAVSVPAFWTTYGYIFNLTVGTPPQELPVLSDWTWTSLFTRSGRCNNVYDVSNCVTEGQSYFNEKKSTTFHNSTLGSFTWPETAFAPNFTVDYARDSVCIDTLCTNNTVLQLSDFPNEGDTIPIQEFGGIYGLAPVFPRVDPRFEPHFFQSWKDGQVTPRVGWNSCAKLSSSHHCLNGDAKYVFGGSDTTLHDSSELTWFHTRNTSFITNSESEKLYYPQTNDLWATSLTGLWITSQDNDWSQNYAVNFNIEAESGETKSHTPMAILDEGSEGLGAALSANAYSKLIQMTSAANASSKILSEIGSQGYSSSTGAEKQPWYLVDCTKTTNFPSLVYELDGRANYTVGPDQYVQKLDGTNQCYLNINQWPYTNTLKGDSEVLLLGMGFLQSLYVIFDFERSEFGLAPIKVQ